MDKSQAKKYTKIAVTLGVIAGGAALLIGLANIITAGPIAKNEYNKKMESIRAIYGEDTKYEEFVIGDEYDEKYPHLVSYFNAVSTEGSEIGNVFVTEGMNDYGVIKMSIGIDLNANIDKIYLIENGQSFGPKLQSDYVDKVNKDEISIDDVNCGATFGAKLINTMGKEAIAYYNDVIKTAPEPEVPGQAPSYVKQIYGENAVYGDEVKFESTAYPNISSYYQAKSTNGVLLGHVFIGAGEVKDATTKYGDVKLSIGINADETIGKVFLIENTQSFGDKVQSDYVDKYNKGEIAFDDVNCGATYGATMINTIGKQALNYVKAEINKSITEFEPYAKEIFGTEVKYIRKHNVLDSTNPTLKEEWTALNPETNKVVGRVYHAELNRNNFMIGINKGGEYGEEDPNKPQTFAKLYLVNVTEETAANDFIASLNAPKANVEELLKENANDSALIKDIKAVVDQAISHAAENKITNPVNVDHLLAGTFGSEVSYCEHKVIDDIANPNLVEYWNVKDADLNYIGRAYHFEAPGQHGALHVVVGVKANEITGGDFYKVATDAKVPTVVVPPSDENPNGVDSRPAVKALEEYIKGLNDGSIKLESEDDTVNGATGTSSGIRNLCLAAVDHYRKNIIADKYLTKTFGDNVTYIERTNVKDNSVIRTYWNVMGSENKYVGRVYHCVFNGEKEVLNTLVSTDEKGAVRQVYYINQTSESILPDVSEVLNHYKANPLLPLLDDMVKLKALFPDQEVTFEDHRKVSGKGYENVVEYWTVKDADGKAIAAAYHCALPGKHAILEVTVSVYPEKVNNKPSAKLGKINLLNKANNEYGDKLQAYVDGLNDGSININDDVHNGATSSSNGVKNIVLQAMNHLKVNALDGGMDLASNLTEIFGSEANYGEAFALSDIAHDNLLEYWDVKDASNKFLGRVYHGAFPGEHGALHVLIGVNADGTLAKIFWANNPANNPFVPANVKKYGRLAQEWIDAVNAGEIKLADDIANGATGTTTGIRSLTLQALDHYSLNQIAQGE